MGGYAPLDACHLSSDSQVGQQAADLGERLPGHERLAGIAACSPRRLQLEVVAAPRPDADGLATAGDPDPLLRSPCGSSSSARRSHTPVDAAPVLGSGLGATGGAGVPRLSRFRPAARFRLVRPRSRRVGLVGRSRRRRCRIGSWRGSWPWPAGARFVRLGLVGRGDADVHRLAFEQRRPLDHAVFLDLLRELVEQIATDLRVGQLASAELDRDLDPVAVFEELDGPTDLGVEVADADLGLEPDFLEGDDRCFRLASFSRLVSSYLYWPKSRRRATGGLASGATSTRSRPRSCASRRASCVRMTPSWLPSSSTIRNSKTRII